MQRTTLALAHLRRAPHFAPAVADRLARRLDDAIVVAAVQWSCENARAIDFVQRLLPALDVGGAFDNGRNGPVAVTDRRQSLAAQIDILEVIGTRFGVGGGGDVRML